MGNMLIEPDVDLKKIKRLLQQGADPNLYAPAPGGAMRTALHRAAIGPFGSLDAVNLLLEAGANPFQPVSLGRMPWLLSEHWMVAGRIASRLKEAEIEYEREHGPQPRPTRPACKLKQPTLP